MSIVLNNHSGYVCKYNSALAVMSLLLRIVVPAHDLISLLIGSLLATRLTPLDISTRIIGRGKQHNGELRLKDFEGTIN